MPPGPTGMHPWLDLTVRLSRAPVVSIASIRGRARGAGSEFVLATDIRLAGDQASSRSSRSAPASSPAAGRWRACRG